MWKNPMKQETSMRLSPQAMDLRGRLAAKLGISLAAVVEQAIRLLAEKEGVKAK